MEVFAAMIGVMDRNIGRLIQELEQRKVFEDTLFYSARIMEDALSSGPEEETSNHGIPIRTGLTMPPGPKPATPRSGSTSKTSMKAGFHLP